MYDVIIIGAGPAGITAGLYTQRGNLKTLIIHNGKTSLEKASKIENYYGFENGIKGEELYNIGIRQAQNIGVEILKDEVTNIQIDYLNTKQRIFKVQTLNNEFEAKSVILATGNKKSKPNIKNLDEYKNKNVAVIGNGDYAISEAMNLQNVAKSTIILTNGKQIPEYRAESINFITKEVREVRRRKQNRRNRI